MTSKKNPNQNDAQNSFLFVVRSPTCFGQIYWPSSGNRMQRHFYFKLSHVATAVVVFAIIKLLNSGLVKYSLNVIKIQLLQCKIKNSIKL